MFRTIRVLSDSVGETGENFVHAIMKQFPDEKYKVVRYSNTTNEGQVDDILASCEPNDLIIATIVISNLRNYLIGKSRERGLYCFDIVGGPLTQLEKVFNKKAIERPGAIRELDDEYFDKIKAIEFTIKYDDGKDPRGIMDADIVLLGVSRTSKTPTSMYLANKGYKVVNVPLVPEITPPKEIFLKDPRRIIGLVIDPVKLNRIREKRLIALGIEDNSLYANDERIRKELSYAYELFDKLGVRIIDVSNSSIEKTASTIIDIMKKLFP